MRSVIEQTGDLGFVLFADGELVGLAFEGLDLLYQLAIHL